MNEFLKRLTLALERAGVPYMLAGSVASSFHGEPRTTQDIDLVIAVDVDGIRRLVAELPAEAYYLDEQTARDALRRQSQFSVIDMATGWKADLIVRKRRPFSEAEFERRQRVDFDGARVWIASPEDVVLSKLEWAQRSSSERQLRDVKGVIDARALDLPYIERWVAALGLDDLWAKVRPA